MNTNIYIDGSNLYHSMKHLNIRLDWKRFLEHLDPIYVHAKYYNSWAYYKDKPTDTHEKFIEALNHTPRLITKINISTATEKPFNVDMQMAIDAVVDVFYNRNYFVHKIIIVSGDKDFLPLVQTLTNMGFIVVVAASPDHLSRDLASAADEVILLEDSLLRSLAERNN